jgi:hypothetical protein
MRDDAETHVSQPGPPEPAILDESPRRRWGRLAVIGMGTLIGFAAGAAVVLLVDRPRVTGSSGNPFVWLVGLPMLLAIGGTVIGWVIDGTFNAEVQDAPARQRRFVRRGRAATSRDGQEPGSSVPPSYRPAGRH